MRELADMSKNFSKNLEKKKATLMLDNKWHTKDGTEYGIQYEDTV